MTERARRRPGRARRLRRARRTRRSPSSTRSASSSATGPRPRWSDVAVLYRKHKHREAIVARLRDEDIPYTVVGGLSLFETPEIRDLEQALRAIADPHDDVALVRMMTAGPWRLDALEILRRRPDGAASTGATWSSVIREIVETGELEDGRRRGRHDRRADATAEADTTDDADADRREPTTTAAVAPDTRAKLRRLLDTLDELDAADLARGPVHDPRAVPRADRPGARPDRRRHPRGAADRRQHRELPALRGRLAGAPTRTARWPASSPTSTPTSDAGGELPTSVELTEDVEGVRLMTLYQAKGLEFPHRLRPGPARRGVAGPRVRQRPLPARAPARGRPRRRHPHRRGAPPAVRRDDPGAGPADPHDPRRPGRPEGPVAVRRRAPRRGRRRSSATSTGRPSRPPGRGSRPGPTRTPTATAPTTTPTRPTGPPSPPTRSIGRPRSSAGSCRSRPPRERRLALRLRATELVGLLEGDRRRRPRGRRRPRRASPPSSRPSAGRPRSTADEARARGLDPLTFRSVALDSGAGANLLQVAPLPRAFSYSRSTPTSAARSSTRSATSTGSRPTGPSPRSPSGRPRTRRSRRSPASAASGPRAASRRRPATTSSACSATRWTPTGFGDKTTEEAYRGASRPCSTTSGTGELQRPRRGDPRGAVDFELTLDPADGTAAGRRPRLDRPDRPPALGRHRGHRLQDRPRLVARRASTRASSCRSTRWPAATRWASARRSG